MQKAPMTPLEEAPRLIDQVYRRLLDAISDHTLLRWVQPLQNRVGGRGTAMAFCFCSTTDWITLLLAEGNRAKFKNAPAPV